MTLLSAFWASSGGAAAEDAGEYDSLKGVIRKRSDPALVLQTGPTPSDARRRHVRRAEIFRIQRSHKRIILYRELLDRRRALLPPRLRCVPAANTAFQ
eukprot:tig00000403_g299.t1